MSGIKRLFIKPTREVPANRAFLERPMLIIGIFLLLSILILTVADYPLAIWMKSFPGQLRGMAKWISGLGTGLLVLSLSGGLLMSAALVPAEKLRKTARISSKLVATSSAFIFISVAGGGLVASLLKNIIGRARPKFIQVDGVFYFRPFSFHADFASFPSGHSATAGAMAISLALVFPRLRPIVVPTGILICLSRQWVGAHWASDTFMGWGVGVAFTLWLAHAFARRELLFTYSSDGYLCLDKCYKTMLPNLGALFNASLFKTMQRSVRADRARTAKPELLP
ncbi:phosphatase PAP2 family protein [Rhizobium sp. P38BS-XIX]|uniref:phosphatase PAP2 family protein n=1 Tax=Rhizobium sp. P38BS-XIX TaxID=2726740 RepID=UPI001FEDA94A|nr:phosphatase PAP2 family protein [Rhizobium sp. P38BS-XIX]